MIINHELRREVIEYSLNTEKVVNDLILSILGILVEGKETKLFGSKSGLTFRNKIDLLLDLDILSKEENINLELFMMIRNRFLHDIECNSFEDVFKYENSYRGRFKKFLDEPGDLKDDVKCLRAYFKLYQSNIAIIKSKADKNIEAVKIKGEIFMLQQNETIFYLELFHDFIFEIMEAVEESHMGDKHKILDKFIKHICNKFGERFIGDEENKKSFDRLNTLLNSEDSALNYMAVRRIPKLPNWPSSTED